MNPNDIRKLEINFKEIEKNIGAANSMIASITHLKSLENQLSNPVQNSVYEWDPKDLIMSVVQERKGWLSSLNWSFLNYFRPPVYNLDEMRNIIATQLKNLETQESELAGKLANSISTNVNKLEEFTEEYTKTASEYREISAQIDAQNNNQHYLQNQLGWRDGSPWRNFIKEAWLALPFFHSVEKQQLREYRKSLNSLHKNEKRLHKTMQTQEHLLSKLHGIANFEIRPLNSIYDAEDSKLKDRLPEYEKFVGAFLQSQATIKEIIFKNAPEAVPFTEAVITNDVLIRDPQEKIYHAVHEEQPSRSKEPSINSQETPSVILLPSVPKPPPSMRNACYKDDSNGNNGP